MRLYSAKLKNGTSNPGYAIFHEGMADRNAKHPDFGGSMDGALVNFLEDAETLKLVLSDGSLTTDDIEVLEVTSETLKTVHIGYVSLVNDYFLPNDDYPAIE